MNSAQAARRRLWLALTFVSTLAATPLTFADPIPAPRIPATDFPITRYGAVPDGHTPATAAIQNAIAAASAAGGGVVHVPAGVFLTGPFTLASCIDLHLDAGAVLRLDDHLANYPIEKKRYQDAITAHEAHDLAISGSGTIDGQGAAWWTEFRRNPGMTHRPYLIKLMNCERVEVSGVTLQNSPMFHLVTTECTDVYLHDLEIHAPAKAPNTDGIDPSGWNYLITRCHIDTGDDNIAIKPCRNRTPGDRHFLVTDCRFDHGHGMSVGGGTAGGLDDLVVRHCTFADTDNGLRIKTHRGGGGLLQHVLYEDLTLTRVKNPIIIIDWYPESKAPKNPATEPAAPVDDLTPFNQDITLRNVTVTNCPYAGVIRGLPEAPIQRVRLENVHLSANTGFKVIHARDVQFVNSTITAASGPNLLIVDAQVTGLTPDSQP